MEELKPRHVNGHISQSKGVVEVDYTIWDTIRRIDSRLDELGRGMLKLARVLSEHSAADDRVEDSRLAAYDAHISKDAALHAEHHNARDALARRQGELAEWIEQQGDGFYDAAEERNALAGLVADHELRLTHQAVDQVSYAGDVDTLAERVAALEQAADDAPPPRSSSLVVGA